MMSNMMTLDCQKVDPLDVEDTVVVLTYLVLTGDQKMTKHFYNENK